MAPGRHGSAGALAAGALVGLVGLVFLVLLHPPGPGALYPPCPFWALTGLRCPGCGSLRAIDGLVHGRFLEGFRLNPLAVILLPYVVLGLMGEAGVGFAGLRAPSGVLRGRAAWGLLAVIVAFGVLRNLAP